MAGRGPVPGADDVTGGDSDHRAERDVIAGRCSRAGHAHGSDAAALGGFLGIKVAAGSTTFEYVIDRYPQLESVASRTWLEPTFLIDFDEPVFATLKTEMKDLGEHPGRIALVDFVARIVDDKEPRGWDLASVVATRRQGDCTEHAVLTTALARMYGTSGVSRWELLYLRRHQPRGIWTRLERNARRRPLGRGRCCATRLRKNRTICADGDRRGRRSLGTRWPSPASPPLDSARRYPGPRADKIICNRGRTNGWS